MIFVVLYASDFARALTIDYSSSYLKCILTGQSILLVFFMKLSFLVFMERCFFLLSSSLVVEDYELSKSTIHLLSVS